MKDDPVEGTLKKIEDVVSRIVHAARLGKVVDQERLEMLLVLLDDLADQLTGVEMIRKDMVGMLWYPFTALLAEADHAQEPDALIRAAWEIKERLRRIFGPLARTL